MVEFNEFNLTLLWPYIILFLSLQESPHFTWYDLMEGNKYCTPVLPESNSVIRLDAHLQCGKNPCHCVTVWRSTSEAVISAGYVVTVVTVSLGPLSTAGWEGYFMCKDILAGLQEDVNRWLLNGELCVTHTECFFLEMSKREFSFLVGCYLSSSSPQPLHGKLP